MRIEAEAETKRITVEEAEAERKRIEAEELAEKLAKDKDAETQMAAEAEGREPMMEESKLKVVTETKAATKSEDD